VSSVAASAVPPSKLHLRAFLTDASGTVFLGQLAGAVALRVWIPGPAGASPDFTGDLASDDSGSESDIEGDGDGDGGAGDRSGGGGVAGSGGNGALGGSSAAPAATGPRTWSFPLAPFAQRTVPRSVSVPINTPFRIPYIHLPPSPIVVAPTVPTVQAAIATPATTGALSAAWVTGSMPSVGGLDYVFFLFLFFFVFFCFFFADLVVFCLFSWSFFLYDAHQYNSATFSDCVRRRIAWLAFLTRKRAVPGSRKARSWSMR
jgi:hypothetical protein